MKTSLTAAMLAALALACTRSEAWDAHGHKTIASVAYRQLSKKERQKIVDILGYHPRFERDFEAKIDHDGLWDSEENEWMFQQAGVWPDLARGIKPEYQKKKYHRPMWHFINMPVFLTDDDRREMKSSIKIEMSTPQREEYEMNAVQIIRYSRRALNDSHTSRPDRARLLCWLIHVVGDIHQPIHSAALFSQNLFPDGDRGGNSIEVEDMKNLHSVWDHSLGKTTEFRGCRNHAIRLVNDPKLVPLGEAAAKDLNEEHWLHESVDIASTVAYGPEVLDQLRESEEEDDEEAPVITVSEDYLRRAHAIARKRSVEAGYRLGAILQDVVNH